MRTAYVYFAVGLIYGFGLGVLLDESNMVNLTSLSLLVGLLILIPTLGWLESKTHHRRLAAWGRIRERGKFVFIGTWYLLLRGGIFSAVLMLSLRGIAASWPIHEVGIPVVLVALFIVGSEEWKDCEREYRIQMRRLSAPAFNSAERDASIDAM
jgi:hypothetical protein